MPIRPEHRAFYASPEWAAIRARILERAEHCCEWCKKPNRELMLVTRGGYWRLPASRVWRDAAGTIVTRPPHNLSVDVIRCVLTIAHLDHNVSHNDDDSNFAALCQRCHLVHDTHQHHANARRTRAERSGQRWILPEMEARV